MLACKYQVKLATAYSLCFVVMVTLWVMSHLLYHGILLCSLDITIVTFEEIKKKPEFHRGSGSAPSYDPFTVNSINQGEKVHFQGKQLCHFHF